MGRAHQLHLQPAEGQPVRREATSSRATHRRRSDAYDLDAEYAIGLLDVRTRSSSRRCSSCHSARASGGRQSGVAAAILGDWKDSSISGSRADFRSRCRRTPTRPASSGRCSGESVRGRPGDRWHARAISCHPEIWMSCGTAFGATPAIRARHGTANDPTSALRIATTGASSAAKDVRLGGIRAAKSSSRCSTSPTQ